jgi:DNA replication protein DnaC
MARRKLTVDRHEEIKRRLQAEADYRQERKTINRIKAAKFTVRPAFENFDFTAKRSITKAEIKEIYTLGWLNDARPLLLISETGVGKTFIAQAVGLHACASGKSVLYMSITALQENLAITRSSGRTFHEFIVASDLSLPISRLNLFSATTSHELQWRC